MAKKKSKAEELAKAGATGAVTGGAAFGLSRIPLRRGSKRLQVAQRHARLLERFDIDPTDPRLSVARKVARKDAFGKTFRGKAIPTKPLGTAIGKAKSVKGIQKKLGKSFIIKPTSGAMSKPTDFLSDLNIERRPGQVRKTLKKVDDFIVQPRLNIKKEFRATVAAGKVTSVTRRTTFRKSQIGAVIPVFGKERKEVISFVEGALKEAKRLEPTKTGILGFDVAKTNRGIKLIEANMGPGDLLNPIKRIKAKSRLLGRLPKRTAIAASIAAGAAATAGALLSKKKPKKKVIFRRIRGRIVPIRVKNGKKKR